MERLGMMPRPSAVPPGADTEARSATTTSVEPTPLATLLRRAVAVCRVRGVEAVDGKQVVRAVQII